MCKALTCLVGVNHTVLANHTGVMTCCDGSLWYMSRLVAQSLHLSAIACVMCIVDGGKKIRRNFSCTSMLHCMSKSGKWMHLLNFLPQRPHPNSQHRLGARHQPRTEKQQKKEHRNRNKSGGAWCHHAHAQRGNGFGQGA